MGRIKKYNTWEDTRGDDNIKEIIGDCLIDLKQAGLEITYQMQRNNNIILIYITGKRIAALNHKDFSFSELKDSVNHLISMMNSIEHPLVEASYRHFGNWKILFDDKSTESSVDIFGDKVKSDISSFGLKFRLIK